MNFDAILGLFVVSVVGLLAVLVGFVYPTYFQTRPVKPPLLDGLDELSKAKFREKLDDPVFRAQCTARMEEFERALSTYYDD